MKKSHASLFRTKVIVQAQKHASRVKELEEHLQAHGKMELAPSAHGGNAALMAQLASVLMCTAGTSVKNEQAAKARLKLSVYSSLGSSTTQQLLRHNIVLRGSHLYIASTSTYVCVSLCMSATISQCLASNAESVTFCTGRG